MDRTDADDAAESLGLALRPGASHYRAYVGPPVDYDLVAAMSLGLLTTLGLRQQHQVLDIGCGSLRIGRLLIPYLNRGGYTGLEPNEWLVHDGIANEIGNDQVRIEGTVAALAPELKVIAPVRSWAMGRDEEIAYARKHGIPVKGGTEAAPYSIDDNLWGRSSEGKWIEDLSHAPDDDVFQLVTRPVGSSM